jgi:ABC-type transporter Mla subunit MlaD
MKTKSSLVREINAAKKRIAKERDRLRELLEDANSILQTTDEAVDALEAAVDSLSQYV